MTATNTTTSPGLAAEARESYDKTMLYVARPLLVHAQHTRKFTVPRGEGFFINVRRKSLLPPATTPLVEGVTPAGQAMTVTNVRFGFSQFGNWVGFSDLVTTVSIDPLLTENAEILGQNAGNTMDIITREAMNIGTNVRFANGRTSRGTVQAGDVITDIEIKKLRRQLKRQNVLPIKMGGKSVYVAIVHPDTYLDLQNTDAYKITGEYSDPERIYDGQVTMLYGILFVESTNAKIFTAAGAGSIDVYSTLCYGQEAVGTVDLATMGLQTIYKSKESGGTDDPLEQRQTQAWKTTYGAQILNDLFIVRLEHAVSA